jgi:hypothetical protein
MAANGDQPFIKVTDTNGKPIVGAILHVYEVGTTTNRAIWSDAALTVPISNPLSGANASNASGDFPRFYMAAGVYKLRAETSASVLIWEWDNIDTGTTTGGVLPIASGGTGAITAPAALTALGAAAASDVTALAAQIAAFNLSLLNTISQPQGRLTLLTNVAVMPVGVTASASVFYTTYTGNQCPIYDGVQFNLKVFSELTLTLSASHVLNSIYDCFIINDSGTVRIVTGPAWTTITAGSGARGVGAGTTEINRINGIWVNENAMATARNGATTYNVAVHQGTYVGSIYIDGTAGQVTCHTDYGQSRKWGVWNAYSRTPVLVKAGDSTASWNYSSGAIRAVNGNSANSITIFSGLPEEYYSLKYLAAASLVSAAASTPRMFAGVGYNSTTVFSGFVGQQSNIVAGTFIGWAEGSYSALPSVGINVITALEEGAGSNTTTWSGTEAASLLTAMWRA